MFGLFQKRYQDLSPSDAAGRSDLTLIDVREPAELIGDLGAIDGVRNVPLGDLLQRGLPEVSKDTTLLMVCRSGGRSGRAAAALADAGYTKVYNLAGGMMAWNDARLPVARR